MVYLFLAMFGQFECEGHWVKVTDWKKLVLLPEYLFEMTVGFKHINITLHLKEGTIMYEWTKIKKCPNDKYGKHTFFHT